MQEGGRWPKPRRTEFHDDLTGFPLDEDRYRRAREEYYELSGRQLERVWSLAFCAVALAEMGGVKPSPLCWVDTNKGSIGLPEYQSRLVVAQTKVQGDNRQTDQHPCDARLITRTDGRRGMGGS